MKPSQKKAYKVCVCAIIKDEFPYLLEWIAYHRVIGVDYFFIYDNESTDGSTELLEKLEKADIITHIKFPDTTDKVTQHAAYNDCLQQARNITEWIAFIDADEFILPHKHQDLKTFLEGYSDVDAIAINWKIFGSSGRRYYEKSLLMERFTECSTRNFNHNGNIKTIAKIDDIGHVGTHTCVFNSKQSKKYIYPSRKPIPKVRFIGLGKYINHDIIQINHYFAKSLEEWNFKRARGRADMHRNNPKKIRDMSFFETMDQNVEKDLKILDLLQQTKDEIKVLKSLSNISEIEDKLDNFRKVYEQKLIDNNTELFLVTSEQEFEKGNQLISLNKVDEAIAAYKYAIKFNPYVPFYYYQLGKILLQNNRSHAAINYFKKATENYKNKLELLKFTK
ncbi:MAG: glycosyltransferase family 92 protein [Trichodesmium sp. MAG_R01]|nr:glycosyltransferase family 92 protein [Trichodesmium sp. MAG_R01]